MQNTVDNFSDHEEIAVNFVSRFETLIDNITEVAQNDKSDVIESQLSLTERNIKLEKVQELNDKITKVKN